MNRQFTDSSRRPAHNEPVAGGDARRRAIVQRFGSNWARLHSPVDEGAEFSPAGFVLNTAVSLIALGGTGLYAQQLDELTVISAVAVAAGVAFGSGRLIIGALRRRRATRTRVVYERPPHRRVRSR